jgi:hypothetical protein
VRHASMTSAAIVQTAAKMTHVRRHHLHHQLLNARFRVMDPPGIG